MTNINLEEINENVNKMAQSTYNMTKDFYTIGANTVEQIFDQQVAMATLGMKSITSQLKLAGTAKSYQAVVTGQADIADVISSTSQDIARDTLDILNESKEGVSEWLETVAKEAARNNPTVKAA